MPIDDTVAADRYRVQVTQGSMFGGLLRFNPRKPPKRGPAVAIIDDAGAEVWRRTVTSSSEASRLAELIQTQVLTARLADFEHWLRTEGAERTQIPD
jgi:hypothetical protein